MVLSFSYVIVGVSYHDIWTGSAYFKETEIFPCSVLHTSLLSPLAVDCQYYKDKMFKYSK